jgi:hypothetical protein
MTDPEVGQVEPRSSVAVSMNSKGEAIVTVKAYTNDLGTMDAAREKAVQVYNDTVRQVRG